MNDNHPTDHPAPHDLDRTLHTQLARLTQGISPASLAGACMDWRVHLAMSPGKQHELVAKATRKSLRLGLYAGNAAFTGGRPCIEPLPQDRRFDAPEWQRWPFNLVCQSFLLHQQWWHNATSGVPGVTAHHEQVATFAMRQVLDMLPPTPGWRRRPSMTVRGGRCWTRGCSAMPASASPRPRWAVRRAAIRRCRTRPAATSWFSDTSGA